MKYRTEQDSMGKVRVPADRLYGAQTRRSVEHFPIGVGREEMPPEITEAFAYLKLACANANRRLQPAKLSAKQAAAITKACREILAGKHEKEFPLVVWQTGSGTQSNMNANEVIANRANQILRKTEIHPNDHVNMGQSSNDTFPTAMHIAAALILTLKLLPALETLIASFKTLEKKYSKAVKSGRTHLMDATPIRFAQEVSGWSFSLEQDQKMIRDALPYLRELAIGGTAVGTGLNAPKGFDRAVAKELSALTGERFVPSRNKFHALSSKDELAFAHGALKALAADLMKIANDIRWMASGPRTGLAEIAIPENEPGSSIMPGKVNPTQCEQVAMVAAQVMGNDASIAVAASQGNFELNVFMPLLAYNFLQSARLLAESMTAFEKFCVRGIVPQEGKMKENLEKSLMLVTALSPHIGYERAANVAKKAQREEITLKEAAVALGYVDGQTFDRLVDPKRMV